MTTPTAKYTGTFSLNKAPNSPYWLVTFVGPDGRQKRRSTKVPHRGGMYQGERLTAAQARKRAELVAYAIATEVTEEYHARDNTTMRRLCELMLTGKLGRVSLATYENARTDYNQFLAWLGTRADAPARLITRADMRSWALARRAEVRHGTVRKALSAIRAAFAWAVDSGIIPTNPCDGLCPATFPALFFLTGNINPYFPPHLIAIPSGYFSAKLCTASPNICSTNASFDLKLLPTAPPTRCPTAPPLPQPPPAYSHLHFLC